MPLVLTNDEKLSVLRRRKQALRDAYAENELTLQLLENLNKEDPQIQGVKDNMTQIEKNLDYIEAQIQILLDVALDALK